MQLKDKNPKSISNDQLFSLMLTARETVHNSLYKTDLFLKEERNRDALIRIYFNTIRFFRFNSIFKEVNLIFNKF